jgi:hypothetical protein
MAKLLDADEILQHASPVIHQQGHEIQSFGHLVKLPIALSESACRESVDNLDQRLADTITLRDMYKKHHWQVIRTNELEVWFVAEHVVDTPVVRVEGGSQ